MFDIMGKGCFALRKLGSDSKLSWGSNVTKDLTFFQILFCYIFLKLVEKQTRRYFVGI